MAQVIVQQMKETIIPEVAPKKSGRRPTLSIKVAAYVDTKRAKIRSPPVS